MRLTAAALALLLCTALHAQQYTPKTIQFQGVPASDAPHLLDVTGLHPGTPLTREQIETALGKLSDTGLFSDLSYKVDGQTLTISLTASPDSQSLPVRFGNIVWWQSADLEKQLEAKVPLYRGELPLNGNLTDQVLDALTAMLAAKGIAARVSTSPSTDEETRQVNGIIVAITQPSILLGNIEIDGAPAEAEKQITKVQGYLSGQDYDLLESPKGIDHGIEEFFHNAGFLDAKADPPSFGPPHKDPTITEVHYLVDAQVTLRDAALYHVSGAVVHAAAPVSQDELNKALKIKSGDAATLYDRSAAQGNLKEPYRKHGYLDAEAQVQALEDKQQHTVSYIFTMVAGDQYRAGGVDTSGLTPDDRAAFSAAWHVMPGEFLDDEYNKQLAVAIARLHSARQIIVSLRPNKRSKIADIFLAYARSNVTR